MANLVSPGVSVTVTDESFYIPGRAATVPLIFIATADEKVQLDGETPALGTYEHNVMRVVTSLRQSLELYGVPKFYASADGFPHHGDARNEYGLDALNKYLEIGNRAYVVRVNVNLDDDLASIKALWVRKMEDAADNLQVLVEDYIDAYNLQNNLVEGDTGFKEKVTIDEVKTLIDEALKDVTASYSFGGELLPAYFLQDHTTPRSAYQDVVFDTYGGYISATDVTGLEDTETYTATVTLTDEIDGEVEVELSFTGLSAASFGTLISGINTALGAYGSCALIAGRLRITSTHAGSTASVTIEDGEVPLFGSLNLFERIAASVPGMGDSQLKVYSDETFSTSSLVGEFTGLYDMLTATVYGGEFTAAEAWDILTEAYSQFDDTKEFREATSLGHNDAAKRIAIKTALQAAINSNRSGVRAEHLEYNIAIAPGFPEVSEELLRLGEDMLKEVFIIGETPFDKPPTGPNGINVWASTPALPQNEDLAVYYGHGISSNIDGVDIMTTSASTALRTYAFNDAETEVWWAPAGTTRGRCTHLSTVGFVSGTLGGPTTFVEEYLDNGTRDELYEKKVNPITFIPGRGILVFGQKTTYANVSALDRVNVSRLIKFIKRNLRKGLFSFLFEPNDQITRNQVKFAVDNFLGDLINRRALYDFATICDLSNNTPERIDRNELYIDVALKPVKSVEFIYVPIRIVRTGADIGTGREITVGL